MSANRNKKRGILGFSMVELMGAVAIIVILAAVAFPSVISMQRDLRMKELDDHAQQIYNAAQNRLSAIKASGAAFNEKDQTNTSTLFGAMTAGGARQQITTMPSDYDNSGERPWDQCELYQLSSDDPGDNAIIREFLFKTEGNEISSSLLDGSYIIELSPKTGEVYAVHYWESAGGKKDAKAPEGGFSYDSVSVLRERSDRKPYNIGYFGGGSLGAYYVAPPNADAFKDMEMDLVNSEELYLRLKSADIGLLDSDERLRNSFRVELYVTGDAIAWTASGKQTWTKTYSVSGSEGSVQVNVTPTDSEMDVILDSMRTDQPLRFSNIVQGILPGSDITVEAKVFCDRGQGNWSSEPILSVSKKTNSLYESVSVDNDKQTANVSAVRHLRNLSLGEARSAITSYPGYDASYVAGRATYNNVSIANDIDFDGSHWSIDSVSVLSRNAEGKAYNPLAFFSPITVSEAMGWSTSSAVVNGNNKTLKNFVISSGDGGDNKGETTGLFGKIAATMQDIRFEDPRVAGANNTGTLAGKKTVGGTVSNCHVYATGKDGVGVVSSGDSVGGLIGNCDCTMTMSNCSVAVDVHGNNYVGGIFGVDGYVQENNCSNCRVGYVQNDANNPRMVTISGDGSYVGGIAGQKHAPASDAHVYATVTGVSCVGGIAGSAEGAATMTDCFVGDADSLLRTVVTGSDANDAGYVGGLVGYTSAGGSHDTVFASVSGGSYVGGLVGQFEGNLFEDCAVKTRTAATSEQEWVTASGSYVGGFFGEQKGQARNCTSSINVQAGGSYVGGFSGRSESSISDCSVHGNVYDYNGGKLSRRPSIKANGDQVGGLVGSSQAAIDWSFAAASIEGNNYVGGLIGSETEGRNIVNCYASGFVTGNEYVGGIAGYRVGQYWNNVFSSSGVNGNRVVGGFVGYDEMPSGLYNCRSYSQVKNNNGVEGSYEDHFGGFAGATVNNQTYPTGRNLLYVNAKTYNETYVDKLKYSLLHGYYYDTNYWEYERHLRTYSEYAPKNPVPRPDITYPFSTERVGEPFRFVPIYEGDRQLPFYGVWPVRVD